MPGMLTKIGPNVAKSAPARARDRLRMLAGVGQTVHDCRYTGDGQWWPQEFAK